MNREILFKAKRIDNGEWVEGQYVYITNPLTEDGKPIKHLICNGTNIFNDLIDPVTLCQYTGLHDNTKWGDLTEAEKESFLSDWNYREDRKNKIEDWSGRKIWENDILVEKHKGIVTIKYRVVFDLEEGAWMLETKSGARYGIGAANQRNSEVCGNIFDGGLNDGKEAKEN